MSVPYPRLSTREKKRFRQLVVSSIADALEDKYLVPKEAAVLERVATHLMDGPITPKIIRAEYKRAHREAFGTDDGLIKNTSILLSAYAECSELAQAIRESNCQENLVVKPPKAAPTKIPQRVFQWVTLDELNGAFQGHIEILNPKNPADIKVNSVLMAAFHHLQRKQNASYYINEENWLSVVESEPELQRLTAQQRSIISRRAEEVFCIASANPKSQVFASEDLKHGKLNTPPESGRVSARGTR